VNTVKAAAVAEVAFAVAKVTEVTEASAAAVETAIELARTVVKRQPKGATAGTVVAAVVTVAIRRQLQQRQ
jgi:hypothetical protein